jgi:hypothetical protein
MLTTPQVRFTLDSETSDPTDVGVYEHKEANSMVSMATVSMATVSMAIGSGTSIRRPTARGRGSC